MKSARHLKRGMAVAVCYDGKYGRRVKGEVIRTDRGSRVLVRFPLWADETDTVIEHWFKREHAQWNPQRQYFGGYVPRERSVMKYFFGLPGDYYAVCRWQEQLIWNQPDVLSDRAYRPQVRRTVDL